MQFTYNPPLTKSSFSDNFEEHAELFVTRFLEEKGENTGRQLFCAVEKRYTLGKTSAVVLKASFGIIGEPPYVRILKYDYYEKLVREEKNWKLTGGDRQGNIFIPRYENPLPVGNGADEQGNVVGYGMLPITEAAEATMSDTVDAVINYIYETYRTGPDALRYQGTRIGRALAQAFDTLCGALYQAVRVSGETLTRYYSHKIDAGKRKAIDSAAGPLIGEMSGKGIIGIEDWPMEVSEPALTVHRAIHGDMNPGNILICEGRGLMGLFTVLIDLMELNTGWKPLYWDAARLECEIILSFYLYLNEVHAVPEDELYEALSDLINTLAEGRVSDLHFDMGTEKGRGNFYLYTIFRTLRHAVFNHPLVSEKNEITRELLYRNHLYAVGTFYRYFLKWKREPDLKRKCALAASQAAVDLYRNDKGVDMARWYRDIKSDRVDYRLFNDRIRSSITRYIPIEANVLRVLQFLQGDGDVLFLEGYMGSGKTSLMAYCLSLINGTVMAPAWAADLLQGLDDLYVIPWFLSEAAPASGLKRYLLNELRRAWPGMDPGDENDRMEHLFESLNNVLMDNDERLVLFIDGVDVDPGVLDLAVLPAGQYDRIAVIYSGRAAAVDEHSGKTRDMVKAFSQKYRGRVQHEHLDLFSRGDCLTFMGLLPAELIPGDEDLDWIAERSGGLPAYLTMMRTALAQGMTVSEMKRSTIKRIGSQYASGVQEENLFTLYEYYFTERFDRSAMPALMALGVTALGEMVSERFIREVIAAVGGTALSESECKSLIGLCAGLLEKRIVDIEGDEGTLDVAEVCCLRHQSLREYLAGGEDVAVYAAAVQEIAMQWRHPVPEISLYALKHGVAHCCDRKKYHDAAGLLTDFEYLMEKTKAGYLEGILTDYKRVMGEAPVEVRDTLKYWNAFFRERAHVLRRGNDTWPSYKILLQLAVEHADNSPVTIAAGRYLEEGKVRWVWMRRNQRTKDVQVKPIVLEGHKLDVSGALQLNDGRILSWSSDKTLRLWGLDGSPGHVLEGHDKTVLGALQLKDGCILSWSSDGTLRLWKADGSTGPVFEGHRSQVNGAVQLKNGRILSWSSDGTLRLWGLDGNFSIVFEKPHYISRNVPLDYGRHIKGVLHLNDNRILSWSNESILRLWGLDGSRGHGLVGHGKTVVGALQLKNGCILSWSSDGTLRLWKADGSTGPVFEGHRSQVNGAVQLKNGRILSWSSDGTLRLWEVSGSLDQVLEGHKQDVSRALELNDGRILSWSSDKTLRLWGLDGSPGPVLEGHGKTVLGALELNDGRILSWSSDKTLRLWGLDGSPGPVLEGHGKTVLGALQLKDGCILSWSSDGMLYVWMIESSPEPILVKHRDDIIGTTQLKYSHNCSFLKSKRLCNFIKCRRQLYGYILSWSLDGTLRLWKADGSTGPVLKGHTSEVNGAVQLKDGRILSWSFDRTLRLWKVDGSAGQVLKGHTSIVNGAVQLKDGRILSWSFDRTLRLWGLDGSPEAVLEGHRNIITGALQLRNGQIISWSGENVLSGRDFDIHLWGLNGTHKMVLKGHRNEVTGVIQMKDGRILSWSDDKTLRLWNLDGRPGPILEGHGNTIIGALQLNNRCILSWSFPYEAILWTENGELLIKHSWEYILDEFPEFRIAIVGRNCVFNDLFLVSNNSTILLSLLMRESGLFFYWQGETKCKARHLFPDGRAVVTEDNGQICFLSLYKGNRRISLEELEEEYRLF